MRYQVLLSEVAEADLMKVDVLAVRQYVLRQLDFLGDHPTALSRPSHFPYREKCQLFPFNFDHGTQRWEFNVMFQYAADEQTIHVLAIGKSVRDFWEGITDPLDPLPDDE